MVKVKPTLRENALKELYEALYDMRNKDNKLFDAMEKAAPHVAAINREIEDDKNNTP